MHASVWRTDSSAASAASRSLYGTDTTCPESTSPELSGMSYGQLTVLSSSDAYPCQPPSTFAAVGRPVRDLARRTAYMAASVPVDVYLIFSAAGTAPRMASDKTIVGSLTVPCIQPLPIWSETASATGRGACPSIRLQWPIQ